ncbi:MAG TPA: FecR domain-containing protein [Chitinophagaceae bacterium]|nr:FecR domain-containing protein [Chitinophagaceae bacterium]
MARSLSGEASPEEEKALLAALQQNPVLQQQYLVLKNSWANGQVEDHGTGAEHKKVSRILQLAKVQELLHSAESVPRIPHLRRKRRVIIKVIMYTCLTGAVAGGTWLLFKRDKTETGNIAGAEQHRYSQVIATQNGSRTRTMLPDGTTVWLNAGSKISYDSDFAGATRDVKLEGEAYFDVTKNPLRPFIVHTAGIDIKVLGTVFNVRSYPEDKTVETTLIRGLVQVTRDDNPQQKPVILHPNEKLIIEKGIDKPGNQAATQHINAKPEFKLDRLDSLSNEEGRLETAWVYNRLEFRGDDFETLAAKLERWYNVSIVFEDEKVKELTFNGSFEKETVEQAFVALKTAAPFNYAIHGHEIKIKSINKN